MFSIKTHLARHQHPQNLRLALRRFASNDQGSLTTLTLILFLLMVMMGGLAIDLMRFEQTRTSLQNTLDRATLASASLNQTLDPAAVIQDYFAKAGMASYLRDVTVTQELNFRNVSADAKAVTNPYFLRMLGQNEMIATGHSAAEQRISNVEISMVLDVSNSMAANNRLVNLKIAAKEFVDTVLTADTEQRIAISLVPFNGQVNLGPDLRPKFTALTFDPNIVHPAPIPATTNSNCLDMPPDVYTTVGISTSRAMPMTSMVDSYSGTNKSAAYTPPTDYSAIGYHRTYNYGTTWCPPIANNVLRLPNRSISELQSHIDGLIPTPSTSINAGFKWGLVMMDPSMRTTFSQLRAAGKIPANLPGRPFEYNDPEAMKVIILMTDGENFPEERMNNDYKGGLSPIFKSDNDGLFSISLPNGIPNSVSNPRYYVPHKGAWQATPWTSEGFGIDATHTASAQPWMRIWAQMRVSYVAWQFYGRPLGGSDATQREYYYQQAITNMVTRTPISTMDSQLDSICDLAKGKGVIVYGIAFEAPAGGQAAIANCASSPAHYYSAAGLSIRTAFRSIAANITQLRLTQ